MRRVFLMIAWPPRCPPHCPLPRVRKTRASTWPSQGYYEMLNANMAVLAAMAKGDMTYDETRAVRAAANIEALTHYDLPMHFIDGTSADDMPGEYPDREARHLAGFAIRCILPPVPVRS